MAAPRRYSDEQRAAMLRLYEGGKSPAEIAQLCGEGTAGVAPFRIPRRTVQEIVTKMAAEAEQKLPTSVLEAESAEAVDRFPVRVAAIFDDEITRLQDKQKRGKLTLADLDRLDKAADIGFALQRRFARRKPTDARGPGAASQAAGPGRGPGDAIERLALEERERVRTEIQPSCAPTRHVEVDPKLPDAADDAPPNAEPREADDRPEAPVSDLAPAIKQAMARRSPAERAEAARRARAALAAVGN